MRQGRGRLRSACAAAASGSAAAGSERERLKAEVMRAVTGTARGKGATSEQRASILELLTRLEAINPTADPATSPLINGVWALLYQGSCHTACAVVIAAMRRACIFAEADAGLPPHPHPFHRVWVVAIA